MVDKHVFILGAGFSVPLGGPLFKQLLTKELGYHWKTLPLDERWTEVITRIHDGVVQKTIGQQLDAEQLIHKLDWMERNSYTPLAIAVAKSLGDSEQTALRFFQKLNACMTHVLATECELFLDEVENESDLWKPYDRWFDLLTPNDTIITFNYDTAVERVAKRLRKEYRRESFGVQEGNPRLIKVHGSVNWVHEGLSVRHKDDFVGNAMRLALGTPGLMKSIMHEEGFFGNLWQSAKNAIIDATHVSIIGYSMPATDNNARMMILDALGEGREAKQRLCLVLGDDQKRINRILSITRPVIGKQRYVVTDTGMYAQDYIADFRRYCMADY